MKKLIFTIALGILFSISSQAQEPKAKPSCSATCKSKVSCKSEESTTKTDAKTSSNDKKEDATTNDKKSKTVKKQ